MSIDWKLKMRGSFRQDPSNCTCNAVASMTSEDQHSMLVCKVERSGKMRSSLCSGMVEGSAGSEPGSRACHLTTRASGYTTCYCGSIAMES